MEFKGFDVKGKKALVIGMARAALHLRKFWSNRARP